MEGTNENFGRECRGPAALGLGRIGQMNAGAKAVLGACKPDIARYCSEIAPGGGRVKACMKEHIHQLSEPCKEALFRAWLRS